MEDSSSRSKSCPSRASRQSFEYSLVRGLGRCARLLVCKNNRLLGGRSSTNGRRRGSCWRGSCWCGRCWCGHRRGASTTLRGSRRGAPTLRRHLSLLPRHLRQEGPVLPAPQVAHGDLDPQTSFIWYIIIKFPHKLGGDTRARQPPLVLPLFHGNRKKSRQAIHVHIFRTDV